MKTLAESCLVLEPSSKLWKDDEIGRPRYVQNQFRDSFAWSRPLHVELARDRIIHGAHPILNSRDGNANLVINIHKTDIIDSSGNYNAYVSGHDPRTHEYVLLRQAGDGYEYFKPDSASSTTPAPINETIAIPLKDQSTQITLPGYITSARVWLAKGELSFDVFLDGGNKVVVTEPDTNNPTDPAYNLSCGFIELTNVDGDGLTTNLSFVDWVGLLLGMSVTHQNGTTEEVPGLKPDAINTICDGLKAQGEKDQRPWEKMCRQVDGKWLGAYSPNMYSQTNKDMVDYYDSYVNDVWDHYSKTPLIIDTQDNNGKKVVSGRQISCTVKGDQLDCGSDAGVFPKPTTADIWGCNSGPFENIEEDNARKEVKARLCAAFQRSTLMLDGGSVQPSTNVTSESYYTVDPTNHYSRLVHESLQGGRGYAFPYDDVNPGVENAAGLIRSQMPQSMDIHLIQ
ncbi:hypothetical protein F5X99DRAFT_415426 [Biscogniauxia marginata]|nr:hypothetical protein F5X99DRAFT_415426 [Biscogniauxia marginata]